MLSSNVWHYPVAQENLLGLPHSFFINCKWLKHSRVCKWRVRPQLPQSGLYGWDWFKLEPGVVCSVLNKQQQEIWVEKELLSRAGQESMGIITKTYLLWTKEVRIIFRKLVCIQMGQYVRTTYSWTCSIKVVYSCVCSFDLRPMIQKERG